MYCLSTENAPFLRDYCQEPQYFSGVGDGVHPLAFLFAPTAGTLDLKTVMPRLEPVIWSKGTVLAPQHLQSQDRFLEDLLQFQLQALQFRPWGFQRLRIDQTALAAGNLAIAEAAGIFPDGLPFDIPESDPAPPARPLAEHFSGADRVDVYLTIPSYREGGVNVSNGRRGAETRYRAEVEMACDENAGNSEKPITVGRKNLRLLVDGENREGNAVLRAARVVKTEAGSFQLDSHFVPPLLDFHASNYLLAIARRLVEVLAAKSTELAGERRHKNQSLADFTTADIPRFWLLYTVNQAMPQFRHLFEKRQCHPEHLYSAMLSLGGSLTTFSLEARSRELPLYDHDSLGACFMSMDERLRLLLDTVIPTNYVYLPLKQIRPAVYSVSLDDERYLGAARMYLAVSAEAGRADIAAKAPHLIKVCSADGIENLIQLALPGVAMSHQGTPRGGIPIRLNFEYFELNQGGPQWEAMVRSRSLAAYVPADLPNPQLELVIVLPGNESLARD